jgi:hypothetical protein
MVHFHLKEKIEHDQGNERERVKKERREKGGRERTS